MGSSDRVLVDGPPTGLAALLATVRGYDAVLVRGMLLAFGTSLVGMLIGFVSQVLLARTLGTHSYGSYLYVMGWTNVALICTLELSVVAVRFVGMYDGAGEWALLRGFLRRSHQLVAGISLAVGTAGATTAFLLPGLTPDTRAFVLLACALLPLMALLQLQASCLQGLKRVVASQLPFQVLRPLLLVIGVVIVAGGVRGRIATATALSLQLVATGAACALAWWLLWRLRPAEVRAARPAYRTGEWLRTSMGFVGISLAQMILSAQADVLIVGTVLGAADAALYGAASQFALLISFGVAAVMFIAQPMIADLHSRRRTAELAELVAQIVRLSVLASVPVFLFVVLGGHQLLGWFGPQFVAAYPVLLVLAIAQLVVAIVGLLSGYLLTMTGHHVDAGWVIAGSAILNLILSAILTPRFGAIGAAAATLLATLIRSVALVVLVRLRIGVRLGIARVAA